VAVVVVIIVIFLLFLQELPKSTGLGIFLSGGKRLV
jgi:preprotein translocase subunit SecG